MAGIQTLEFRTVPRIAALLVLLVQALYSSTTFYLGFFTAVLLMGNVEVRIEVPKILQPRQEQQEDESEESDEQPPVEPQQEQQVQQESEEFLIPPVCFEDQPPLTQEHEE